MSYKKESPVQTLNEQLVIIKDDRPLTTSRKVAEIFGKRHDHVLRDIENLKIDAPKKFTAPNFGVSSYKDKSGKKSKEYLITKNGLSLLAMGFTGAKALQFKISFIEAFDQMQEIITKRLYGEGVTLSEIRKKVPNQQSLNFIGEEDCRMYLLSEVLKYLGYSNINHDTKIRYAGVIRKWNGKLWCAESFVKLKIKGRAAINERKAVLQDCERILIAEKKKAKFDRELNKKFGF
jgi:Rha family phage regulatory protein